MGFAFLFPGQGSQFVGMGADVFREYSLARETYKEACEILDFDLEKVSFEGPEDELRQTRITQPAIFVHSMALVRLLKERDFAPEIVAGHSLGEYSALVVAGVFSFADGLRLVKLRGALMQKAGQVEPGTMAAVIGLSPDQVEGICHEAESAGVVVLANYNAPGQIAISGSVSGVKRAMELARDAGAKRVIELVVSGAFHSPLMAAATEELAGALQEIEISRPVCPVVPNVTASPTSSRSEIRELLVKQLTHPVRWVETVQNMLSMGFSDFVEIGPGKVLSGLLRRIDRTGSCFAVGSMNDLEKIRNKLVI
jgi:[acyl-carrier-protein] S-malonyltransferase